MSLRLDAQTDDERHAHWVRIAERIRVEQGDQAWSHSLFRLVRGVFSANQALSAEGGYVFNWIAGAYVDSALMLIRRELDQQAGTENLRNLLFDLIEHPGVLTRARYWAQWQQSGTFDREHANIAFDSFSPVRTNADAPSADDYIDPAKVRIDLETLIADAERLREYAERTRAHRTPERGVSADTVTFAALHQTISDIRKVVGKYYALLTQSVIAQWEPVPQYDVVAAFLQPWVKDRDAVARALEPEA